jgi:hypothetical protein
MSNRIFLVAVFGLAAVLNVSAQVGPLIRLPSDGSATILTLDYRGGYGPERKVSNPVLSIHADGNAAVMDSDGKRLAQYKLTASEIQEVMQYIVSEQEFFGIDLSEIDRGMVEEDKKTGTSVSIFDVSTTVIHVTTADKDLEIRLNALGTWVNRYPKIQPLQRLDRVENRLIRLMDEFKPGARQTIAAALVAVNEAMKQEHPELPPMTLDEYRHTGSDANGTTSTQFIQPQGNRDTLIATVTVSPGLPPRVTLKVEPRLKICFDDGTCIDSL